MTLPGGGQPPQPQIPEGLSPAQQDQLMVEAMAQWRAQRSREARATPSPSPSLGDIAGGAAQVAQAVLSVPKAVVQAPAGALLQAAIGATDKLGLQPPGRMEEMQARQARGETPFQSAIHTTGPLTVPGPGPGGLQHPLQIDPALLEVAAEVATDPLTYVGGGYGALARTGSKIAAELLPQGPQLASLVQTFSRIETIDKAAAQLPWQAISAGGDVARQVIGAIPVFGALKITDAAGNLQPARTLGEWALATAKQGRFTQRVRELADTAANLMRRGGSLLEHLGVQNAFSEPGNIPAYTTTVESTKWLDQTLQTLHQEAQAATDPQTRILANEVLAQTDKALNAIQDTAQTDILHHARISPIGYKAGGAPLYPPPVEAKMRAAWQTAHDESVLTLQSARQLLAQVIQDPARFANGLLPDISDPAHIAAIEQAVTSRSTSIAQTVAQTGQDVRGLVYNPQGGPRFVAQLARNQAISGAYDTARSALGGIVNPQDATAGAQTLTDLGTQLGGRLGDIKAMGKSVLANRAPVVPLLPERLGEIANREWTPIRRSYESLVQAQNTVEDALKEAWSRNELTRDLPYPTLPTSTLPADRYSQINQILAPMGKAPVQDFSNLVETIRGDLTPQTGNKLMNVMQHWVGGDLLTAEPYQLIVDEVARAYARQYGITGPKGVEAALRDATALFKEQALHSPSYPVINALSGILAGKAEGIPAGPTLQHLSENIGDAWAGRPVVNSNLRTAANIWDMAIPDATKSSAGLQDINAVREAVGRGVTASARIGAPKLAAGMAAVGATAGAINPLIPEDQRGQAALIGGLSLGAYGAAWPTITKYLLTRLGGGLEATMRQDAFLFGMSRAVAARAPELADRVDAALLQTRPTINAGPRATFYQTNPTGPYSAANPRTIMQQAATRQVTQAGATPQAAQQASQMIRDANGMIGPNDLYTTLVGAGAPEAAARDVSAWWRTTLDGASREGTALVNRVHIDYETLTNIEQLLKSTVPFSTWPIRMTPFFLQHIIERPAILLSLIQLNEVGQHLIDERGLTSRFQGSIPIGLGDAVLSSLMGRPVQGWYNIMRGIVPFSGAAQGIQQSPSEQQEPLLQQLYKAATSFGPSLHPAAEAILRATAFSPDEPARGPIRIAEPLRALTGVDVNAAPVQIERLARNFVRGRMPVDTHEMAVQRRIDELALQETGQPIGGGSADVGPYLAAKATRSGPIWEHALAEANRERTVRGTLGWLAQPLSPQTLLTPQEAAIRAAKTPTEQGGPFIQFDPTVNQQMQDAMAQGRGQSPATPLMVAAVRDYADRILGPNFASAAVTSRNRITPISAFFQVGTIAAMSNLRTAISDVQAQANPLTRGYQTAGSPEESQLEALLATYSNPAALLQQAMPGATPQDRAAFQRAWQMYQQAPDALRAAMSRSQSGPMALVNQYTALRDQYAAANPLLAEYIAWQRANPGEGSKEAFLRQHFSERHP